MVSSWEQATHSGGCGFCSGFGTTARSGNLKNSPSYSQPWFQNMGSVARTASSQTSRLSRKRRLNGCSSVTEAPFAEAHLHPAVGDQIERRHLLRHPRRVVGGELDDAVAETDVLGALAGGPQEHFRRRGVGILLEEVMLHLPRVVVAQPSASSIWSRDCFSSRCSLSSFQSRGSWCS
jgi:hypothetical protein